MLLTVTYTATFDRYAWRSAIAKVCFRHQFRHDCEFATHTEQAARDLLVRYPEVPDGHDRLGMVYAARGQNREAADCYRRVIDFVHTHPEDHDPAITAHFLELIAKLDPPAATS